MNDQDGKKENMVQLESPFYFCLYLFKYLFFINTTPDFLYFQVMLKLPRTWYPAYYKQSKDKDLKVEKKKKKRDNPENKEGTLNIWFVSMKSTPVPQCKKWKSVTLHLFCSPITRALQGALAVFVRQTTHQYFNLLSCFHCILSPPLKLREDATWSLNHTSAWLPFRNSNCTIFPNQQEH